jgi:metal-responsive CopG/Arc/MetJ family transcriptional regulator
MTRPGSERHDEPVADGGDAERRKFTQRMPEELVEDIDEFADAHGMSRNAAINMLAKTGLEEF